MQVTDATLRHRELTQELFNIGDEMATYIENLIEAIRDWDIELVDDCVAEFEEIAQDARNDARSVSAELLGLRQALVSGVASGRIARPAAPAQRMAEPKLFHAAALRMAYPIQQSPVVVRELTSSLDARAAAVVDALEGCVEWVLAETERGARDLQALNLSRFYAHSHDVVCAIVNAWREAVALEHPGYARTMRGTNPPQFLNERARIDAVVAKVAAKRHAAGASVG
ncbi:hypothetical protein [Corynebacterium pelargi]|uniref:Uncharacterized protein n=1 Tax=Corynebacterium pelargi TaxID=1471400 RepID=A0A410W7E4_9CORY|nr:hypothetical protein [Corynebacterium pelargi]QAU51895.1 hypothetical protein CPELA_03060 [Corynebacterium pelargi]GGG71640.1 hypothetical protein GCM10007338_05840 [Corynebacterium pelargi]